MDVSIILPTYNESDCIGEFLNELQSKIDTDLKYEIIVVNDGSTDSTSTIIEKFNVKVINHKRNKGYGASLKTGIKSSNAKKVLICDSDGQHRIEDINKLLKYKDEPMVIGKRSKESYIQRNRILGKSILKVFANFLSGQNIPDLNSGLRLIDNKIISKYLHLLPDSFSASTTMTLIFMKRNYEIIWEEIIVKRRIGVSTVKQVRHGMYTIILIVRMILLFNPLKIFLPMSLIFFIAGLVWGVFFLSGGLSVFAAILIILSVVLFCFGLISDQISSLRLEKYE